MPFPTKFRHLIELDPSTLERPQRAWIAYGVCAVETHACGWRGWTLAGVGREPGVSYAADDRGRCPRCGRPLVHIKDLSYSLDDDQESGFEFDVVDSITFVDDPDALVAEDYRDVELRAATFDGDGHAHCEVCGTRITSDPYECEAFTYKDGCWLCARCHARVQRALASADS